MNVHRELRPFLAAARRAGWTVENGSRHVIVRSPDGPWVPLPRAGSLGTRQVQNYRRQLRHAGLNV